MAFKWEDDDLYGKKVKSGTLEEGGKVYYWLNGKGEEHSAFSKLASEDKTRQTAWEKAVWAWRCDENGKVWYKDKLSVSDFHLGCDHNLCRDLGQLFLGLRDSEGNDISLFDDEVAQEVKNSKPASVATMS